MRWMRPCAHRACRNGRQQKGAGYLQLTGCITALATPFRPSGDIDLEGWERLLERQLAAGVDGVVVAGSTGEAAALEQHEYETLLVRAVELVAGRIVVLAGTGLSSTNKTIRLTQRAHELGAQAALVVTPPYVRPTQEGLFRHYLAIAERAGVPLVLYNVPSRTGCDMLPETVARLCPHENVIGVKEARPESDRMASLLALCSSSFAVLSGDDPTFLRAMLGGADGVISVASNVVPAAFRRLCDLIAAGEGNSARSLDARLSSLYRFLGVEPNPVPLKAILQRAGIGHGLRLPLLPLSPQYAGNAEVMTALCRHIESEVTGLRAETEHSRRSA